MKRYRHVSIVVAEDDPEDRELTAAALRECRVANDVHFVDDGEALIDWLRGAAANQAGGRRLPALILLDLNMPKLDGREALAIIKQDRALRRIPVIALTTSTSAADVADVYNLGANSYVAKPVTFGGLVEAMRAITHYWFELVELPREHAR